MSYKQKTPVPVVEGGTGKVSYTAYSVVSAGTTTTGAFQNVSGLGTSGQVLTSTGSSSLPTWQDAPTDVTNVVYDALSSDPSSPSDGDVWANTTSADFKGQANGTTVTFTVT